LAISLAQIPQLQYIKLYPERLAASNVLSQDGKKNPVVKVGGEGIVGVELLIDPSAKVVQFYALTSTIKADFTSAKSAKSLASARLAGNFGFHMGGYILTSNKLNICFCSSVGVLF
jgi:hypothetical protein